MRDRTGRTVLEWIIERRMLQARRMLATTDAPVATLGREVGFPDLVRTPTRSRCLARRHPRRPEHPREIRHRIRIATTDLLGRRPRIHTFPRGQRHPRPGRPAYPGGPTINGNSGPDRPPAA